MVQARAIVGVANVHPGSLAHSIKAFEDLNRWKSRNLLYLKVAGYRLTYLLTSTRQPRRPRLFKRLKHFLTIRLAGTVGQRRRPQLCSAIWPCSVEQSGVHYPRPPAPPIDSS